FDDKTVKGPLSRDKALCIAKALMDGLLPSEPPQQTPSSAPPPVVNGGISQKQLDTLSKNPKWERDEICKRYHVPSLEGLTKQQASEAIKTSMARKR
ncbi:MAG: hypothetical protein J6X55_06035, partial [Victivallales bacterium]|nr:hypothetical protein [Victivallales bacterium]